MNIIKKIGIINRGIKFAGNIKKHLENNTLKEKLKIWIEDEIAHLKELADIIPNLKPEIEFFISEIKKLFQCEKKK